MGIRNCTKRLFMTTIVLYFMCQAWLIMSSRFSTELDDVPNHTNQRRSKKTVVVDIILKGNKTQHNNEISKELKNPETYETDGGSYKEFQPLDSKKFGYVISAFALKNDELKIFGVVVRTMRTINASRCQFYESDNKMNGPMEEMSQAVRMILQEHHGLKYGAAYFTCKIPRGLKPYAVSLVEDKCDTPSNFLPIQYPQKQKWEFTVCVTPFNYNYNKAYELVEMVELNQVLGANQIVFYNYSTSENVDQVLKFYIDQGIVQVIQWHLPMKVDVWPKIKNHQAQIHYFGQLASLNDCLYRNRYSSKYVVYQDLDEFIFPHQKDWHNWGDMIRGIGESHSAYMFRNVFFRKEWNNTYSEYPGKDIAKQYKAVTLLKLQREAKVHGPRHRSKYIIDPRRIEIVGIHNIWKFVRGSSPYNVNPERALLHHYRNWENPADTIQRVEDDTIMRFKDKLVTRLKHTWAKLPNVSLN